MSTVAYSKLESDQRFVSKQANEEFKQEVENTLDLYQAEIIGIATSSTDPGTPTGYARYDVYDAATLANFLDDTATAIEVTTGDLDAGKVSVVYDPALAYWTKVIVPVDLTNVYTKTDTDNLLATIIGQQTIITEILQPVTQAECTYTYTTSTFSGWGCPIGVAQGFNRVTIKFRTRATPVDRVDICIKNTDKVGAVVYQVSKTGLALAALTEHEVVFDFPVIDNIAGDQLYLMYATDQYIDKLATYATPYPTPTYAISSYTSAGNFNFGTSWNDKSGVDDIFWHKLDYVEELITPDETFADNVIAVNAGLQNAIAALPKVNNLQEIILPDNTQLVNSNSPGWVLTTSTFSGNGAPIDVRQNFNGIKFRIRARSTAITSVWCWVKVNDNTGTLLQQGTILVNIPPYTEQEIMWVFDEIENASADKLFFAYAANQLCDTYGVVSSYATGAGYGQSVYYAGGAQSGNGSLASFQYAPAIEIGTFEEVTMLSDRALAYVLEQAGLPTVRVELNSQLYATEGKELNVYWDNIISCNFGKNDLEIDVTCTKGKQMERRWTYTPVSADAGSTSFAIAVKYKGEAIASASATLITKAASGGSGSNISILAVGDSTLSSGQWIDAIVNESLAANPNITFVGTLGTGAKKYEGRGGWTWADYATVGRTLYVFNLTGVTISPGIGATYTHNGSTYTVAEVNITGGTGYISATRTSGSNNPLSSGTLTKASGTGDATLNFGSTSTTSANPFWNSGTGQLDIPAYLTDNSITLTSGDVVAFALGINDVFGAASDVTIAAIKTRIDALISAWQTAVPGIIIAIGVIIPPSGSQDAFGENYTNGQTMKGYLANRAMLNDMILEEYDSAGMRSNNVYTVPFNCNIDRLYNYPKTTVAVNARNSTDQVTKWTNGVHPDMTGYNQMADSFYGFIKSLF